MIVNKLSVPIEARGEVKLKNIQRSVPVYEIAVSAERPSAASTAATAATAAAQNSAERPPTTPAAANQTQAAHDNAERPPAAPAAAGAKQADPSPAGAHSDARRAEQTAALEQLVRATVLGEIKSRGRRITLDEAQELFPSVDDDTLRALQQLLHKGLIARSSGTGASGSPGAADANAAATGAAGSAGSRRGAYTPGRSGTTGSGYGSAPAHERDLFSRIGSALREAGILGGGGQQALTDQQYVEQYRAKVERDAGKHRAELAGHLGSYLGVNAFLFLINMVTSPGFPWFLFPLFGWGIGTLNHIHDVKRKQDAVRHLEALPNLDRAGLKMLQEYEQARSSMGAHIVSTVGTSALLVMINLVTSPGFPWSLIPIGAMGIGLVAHLAAYPGKIRKLRTRMERAGILVPSLPLFRPVNRLPKPGAEGYTRTQQARIIRSVILSQYKKARKAGAPLERDFPAVLDTYVNQIEDLEAKCIEVKGLVSSIPTADLERDLVQLQRRKASTDDQRLQREYAESIRQIEQHRASYRELVNQQEMLNLRLTGALNSLKQLQIDLVRMQSISHTHDSSMLEDLRVRSEDLTRYLSDVERGFAELG